MKLLLWSKKTDTDITPGTSYYSALVWGKLNSKSELAILFCFKTREFCDIPSMMTLLLCDVITLGTSYYDIASPPASWPVGRAHKIGGSPTSTWGLHLDLPGPTSKYLGL